MTHTANHASETRIKQFAAKVYATFDQSERNCVRFGMFPAKQMRQAEAELHAEFRQHGEPLDPCELSRLLAVGIMDAANAGKDKLVV